MIAAATSPDWRAAAAAVAAAAVLACAPKLYRVVRYFPTVVHEIGHAFACLVVGGRVTRVDLRFDSSGTTSWRLAAGSGRRGRARLRSACIAGAGYPAPPLAGAAIVALVAAGHVWGVLVGIAVTVAVVAVLWVRAPWGLAVCAAVLGSSCALAVSVPPDLAATTTLGAGALLAFGGLRDALGLFRLRHPGPAGRRSDAALLQDLVWVRWWLWSVVFTAAAAAACAWIVVAVAGLRSPGPA